MDFEKSIAYTQVSIYTRLMNKTVSQIIKGRRLELGLTQLYVANKVEVSEGTVSRWESGNIANMGRDKIAALAAVLKLNPGIIAGWDEEVSSAPSAVKIPVLGRVPAGIPFAAIECIIDYEEIPTEMARTGEFFGLQIKGDSMAPRILDGDIVIVRKQPNVETGDIAIIMVNGDDATCKRVMHHENGLSLVSNNPTFQPRFFTAKEIEKLPVQIIGKVVELRGKF